MLSIMIMTFPWVPLLQPVVESGEQCPRAGISAPLYNLIEFSEVFIVAWQKRNVCYSCPVGIIHNFSLDHYPYSCIFKAKNLASARC